MLRYRHLQTFFCCTCSHTSCCATDVFCCNCAHTHTSCFVTEVFCCTCAPARHAMLQTSFVALTRIRHATLKTFSVAPAHTYMMLHYKRLLLNLRTLAPSTCVKTCWRRQRRQYARRCMTKRSQFQTVGVGKWTMGTLCSWPNQKKTFQRKKQWSWQTIRQQKQ